MKFVKFSILISKLNLSQLEETFEFMFLSQLDKHRLIFVLKEQNKC